MRYVSHYVVDFTTIDGLEHHYSFEYHQERVLHPSQRIHSEGGVTAIGTDGRKYFFPWHQVKVSSYTEDIIGEPAR